MGLVLLQGLVQCEQFCIISLSIYLSYSSLFFTIFLCFAITNKPVGVDLVANKMRRNNVRVNTKAVFLEFLFGETAGATLMRFCLAQSLLHFHNLFMMRITTYIPFNHRNNCSAFQHQIRTYNE